MVKTFGNFEFDDGRRDLRVGGRPVRISAQALDLLSLLLDRPGQLVTREEIQRALWPGTNVEFEHSLDVVVSRLRTVLGDRDPSPRYIQTVPRKGYRFIEPVVVRSGEEASRRVFHWSGRLVTYVAVAIVAAVLAIVFAHSRYEKFVPSHVAQPSPNVRNR